MHLLFRSGIFHVALFGVLTGGSAAPVSTAEAAEVNTSEFSWHILRNQAVKDFGILRHSAMNLELLGN